MTSRHLNDARYFAAALDRCDFDEAARLIAEDCQYHAPAGVLVGVEAIVDSYRESDAWARQTFDRIGYESEVAAIDNQHIGVTYTDHTTLAGATHRYRCRQVLTFGHNGRIRHIRHEELPGERAALDAFFARHGIHRG